MCGFLILQWFWGSIQMDARAGESMYLFEKVCIMWMSSAQLVLGGEISMCNYMCGARN